MLPVDEPELTPDLIRSRHDALLARLRAAAEAASRDPDAVRIVAVTKGFDIHVIRAALGGGLSRFGENRIQEAIPKLAAAPDAEWHLVGHLQGNKARPAVRGFAAIHSVDSIDLLLRLDRIASEEGLEPIALLQVNASGEASKAGFDLAAFSDELRRPAALLAALAGLVAVRVTGLMTIGPAGAPAEESRRVFGTLRRLRDELQQAAGRGFPELSMGMTADAEAAVAEGATLVRIGTGIFGPRLA